MSERKGAIYFEDTHMKLFFDNDDSAFVTGHCAFDEQKVLIREYFEYFQAAHFHLCIAGLAGHPHTFHYFSGEGGVTERTGRAEAVVLTVGLFHDTAEAVTLHNTLEAFTFGGTYHRYTVAFLKHIGHTYGIAEVFAERAVAKLEDSALGSGARFFEVTAQTCGGVFYFALAVCELEGRVAVVILGANLRNHARTSFYNGASNVFAVVVVDTGHADFFSNQTVHAGLKILYLNDIAMSETRRRCCCKTRAG